VTYRAEEGQLQVQAQLQAQASRMAGAQAPCADAPGIRYERYLRAVRAVRIRRPRRGPSPRTRTCGGGDSCASGVRSAPSCASWGDRVLIHGCKIRADYLYVRLSGAWAGGAGRAGAWWASQHRAPVEGMATARRRVIASDVRLSHPGKIGANSDRRTSHCTSARRRRRTMSKPTEVRLADVWMCVYESLQQRRWCRQSHHDPPADASTLLTSI
jgi:hypothetical protein